MVRKSSAALLRDIVSYVTGATDVVDASGSEDRWIFPVDNHTMLAEPLHHFGPLDRAGLPLQDLSGVGIVTIPSRTAAFGFAHWNALRLGVGDAGEHRRAIIQAAEWFAAHPRGRIVHDFPLLGLAPGWLSALAQGEGLSLLARAHLLDRDIRWKSAAIKLANWLAAPLAEGGTAVALPDGGLFLEEYPATRHAHVLNGCLYACVGLIDAHEAFGLGRDLADQVIASVVRNASHWRSNGWSLYQWRRTGGTGNFNTPTYQVVHIALLRHLARTMQRPELADEAAILACALASPRARLSALAGKLRYRLTEGY